MPERNWVARAALMRKGGVHARSRSSQRFSQDQLLWDEIEEYFDESEQQQEQSRGKAPADSEHLTGSPGNAPGLKSIQP